MRVNDQNLLILPNYIQPSTEYFFLNPPEGAEYCLNSIKIKIRQHFYFKNSRCVCTFFEEVLPVLFLGDSRKLALVNVVLLYNYLFNIDYYQVTWGPLITPRLVLSSHLLIDKKNQHCERKYSRLFNTLQI